MISNNYFRFVNLSVNNSANESQQKPKPKDDNSDQFYQEKKMISDNPPQTFGTWIG